MSLCSRHRRGNMRLILIDNNSGLIFGDTANYLLGRLDEWRDNNSDNSSDIERLSLLAARLLDDSIGDAWPRIRIYQLRPARYPHWLFHLSRRHQRLGCPAGRDRRAEPRND